MKKAILPIFAALGLALTPAAFASEKFEVEFEYSTVEVSTEEGAEKIYAELEAVIERQCEIDNWVVRPVKGNALEATCVDRSIADVVEQMQAPELTKIHEAKRG